ncbi:hypothetical protein FJ651_06000 [Paucihalobacter ruber]|uniref:Uncharacterized protein n=1 Tax=Paucihalobacter ruber TaxID=2567861 RepID=A0A506PN72_9FLAO|nr:hypothetical protein [Paucihalobacter ruber]TPV35074.1 hypothetical protein FJ651_06000 [Paucihalobacter ruber]
MNILKSFRQPYLSIFLSSIILLVSCSSDDNHLKNVMTPEQLLIHLKNDNDFNLLVSKNTAFSNLLFNTLKTSQLKLDNDSNREVDLNNLMIELDILGDYIAYSMEINVHLQNIKSKYPNLAILTEDNILNVYNNLSTQDPNSRLPQRLLVDCDAQFQSDMQVIHDQYDTAVSICTIATLLTLALASPCFIAAVGNATFQTAVAIDRHTLCTRNQNNN